MIYLKKYADNLKVWVVFLESKIMGSSIKLIVTFFSPLSHGDIYSQRIRCISKTVIRKNFPGLIFFFLPESTHAACTYRKSTVTCIWVTCCVCNLLVPSSFPFSVRVILPSRYTKKILAIIFTPLFPSRFIFLYETRTQVSFSSILNSFTFSTCLGKVRYHFHKMAAMS